MTMKRMNKKVLANGLMHHGITFEQAAKSIGLPEAVGPTDTFFAKLVQFMGLRRTADWDYKNPGASLTAYRLRTGLTKQGAAIQFGVVPLTIKNWEEGKSPLPAYVEFVTRA